MTLRPRFVEPVNESLAETVRSFLERYRCTLGNGPLLAAVSGGPDSVALLHLLHECGRVCHVGHVNHGLRGVESDEDARFVEALAESFGFPFHVFRECGAEKAASSRDSFEMHAREVRYAFLTETALREGCAAVATGHQRDDVAETLLMRILRGTSVRGLSGIPEIRDENGVSIVRPLLSSSRHEILDYLSRHSISYREDSTNLQGEFLRNRVRNELIPELTAGYNPKLADALNRLAESAQTDESYLEAMAKEAYGVCIDAEGRLRRGVFAELHPAIRRRVVQTFAWRSGADLPHDRLIAAVEFVCEGAPGQRFDLSNGVSLQNSRDVCEASGGEAAPVLGSMRLSVPGDTRIDGALFHVELRERDAGFDPAAVCSPTFQVFDGEVLGTELAVRPVGPGDRFRPLGMDGSKKVAEYLSEQGVAHSARRRQLVLASGEEIVWVVGRAVSGYGAVTGSTRRLLEVRIGGDA